MIRVYDESSSRDGVEIKFDSVEDMLGWISDPVKRSEFDDNDSEVYLRVVDSETVTSSISIGVNRFSPENELKATVTIGKETHGPKYFKNYDEAFEWVESVFEY